MESKRSSWKTFTWKFFGRYLKKMSATQKMEKIIKMIPTLTSYSYEYESEEAQLRNTALVKMHGHIPSYSLWDADSVGDEQSCLRWWKGVFSDLELDKLDEETMMWFWRIGKSIVRHELDGVLQRALKLANSVSDEIDMLDALSDEETEWTGAQETEEGRHTGPVGAFAPARSQKRKLGHSVTVCDSKWCRVPVEEEH